MAEQQEVEPGPETGAGPRFDACMAALRGWRAALVNSGDLPFGQLKESHLKQAVTRGNRDQKQIASMLPNAYAHLAQDILAVINDTDPAGQPPRAEPATPPAGSVPPPTGGSARPDPSSTTPIRRPPDSERAAGPGKPPGPPPPTPPTPAQPEDDDGAARLAELAATFAELDFSEEIGEPARLRVRVSPETASLSWDRPEGGDAAVLYHVVTKDDEPPYDPKYAELLDITSGLSAEDVRPFVSGVRYFQVWRYSGPTEAKARRSQPRLHAEAAIVAPVQQLNLREDGGRVIGQWSVLSNITRVHVFRIPIERAAQAGQDPQYLLDTGDTNLSGFIDRDVIRGRSYLYRFYAEAEINGVARTSTAVGKTMAVSALLSPVEDLSATGHGDADDWQFDLSWTAPKAGRVVVYRTVAPPAAGLESETRDEATLETFGLPLDFRLVYPTQQLAGGRTGMREVPCPPGWDRVYFTPVTLLEGKARVGRSFAQAVIPTPEEPVVVERTEHQILKFGWPGQAASVAVSVGPAGMAAATPVEGAGYLEVSRDSYRRLGGLQFPRPLPPGGCSVHLAGVAFVNLERVYGQAVAVEYPGLLRMHYRVEIKRSLMHNPDRALIWLAAEQDLNKCPPFVLVHHPDRLPLHARDGEPLAVTLDVDEATPALLQFTPPSLGPQFSDPAYRANVRGRVGFIRLFADIHAKMLRQVALLDPPVQTLILKA